MKRLLAMLGLLLLGPAVAQEVNPYANATQTGNLVPDWSFDGPVNTIPQGWNQIGAPGSGGSIQGGCGGLSNQGQCYKFSYMGATLSTNIDLSQYQTNSFEFYFDFFYRMNCNNNIGGYCENPNGTRDIFGASVQFFTTNGEAGSFNFIPIGPDYFKVGDPGVNEFGYKPVGWYSSQSSEYLFTSAIISFYGQDMGYWGGYYGPSLDRVSFRIGYLPPPEEPTITTDCTITPTDPACAVLIYTDPALIADTLVDSVVADATSTDTTDQTQTGSDDGSDDGTDSVEEETTVANATDESDNIDAVSEEDTEETIVAEATTIQQTESQIAFRELTDEEKAAILADAISKSAIESALAIANTAAVAGSASATETVTTTTSKVDNLGNEIVVENNVQTQENTNTQEGDLSAEILNTGVAMNNASQKELQTLIENVIEDANQSAEQSLASSNNLDAGMVVVNDASVDNSVQIAMSSAESAVTGDVTADKIVDNIVNPTNDKTFNDDNDTEILTTILDSTNPSQVVMNIIQPFNFEPNAADREQAGVMSKKEEDKSDAEKRSEQIVAANKEEQDAINSNYMDADQSGIIGAIGNDTDVASYRTAMIQDNNIWYKPEDIYKTVKYDDNKRGMYFLEKGNTDTYKKMVEEQYK